MMRFCSIMLSLLATGCLAGTLSSDEPCAGAACHLSSFELEDARPAHDSFIHLLQRKASYQSNGTGTAAAGGTCDAFGEAYPGLAKVDFNTATLARSNLGGAGPASGPEELYYNDAATVDGVTYDLRVTVVGDSYTANKAKWNGESGHYGIINVECGSSVDLEFQLINQGTKQPEIMKNLVFSWFDLDSGTNGGGDESVLLWPGFTETAISTTTELDVATVPCPAGAGKGECKLYASTTGGTGKDNPKDPMSLTAQQAARTFAAYYKDVSSFRVRLAAKEGFGGRNFLFTGMSQVAYASVDACCPDHICTCKSSCQEQTDISWKEKCSYARCHDCDECHATTSTTTTPYKASKEETCNSGVTLEFETLGENTFGQDNGRLLFKNVVEHEGRSLDLIVTDAAAIDLGYKASGFDTFAPDERGYSGIYKTAGRIAVDQPGKYMLRFKLADSTTGNDAKLPLFPFVFYDLDGRGEAVMACNVAGVITHDDTTLTEKFDDPCYHHLSPRKEVGIPRDFEKLTPNQKKQSVTYVYRNTGVWDIGFSVHQGSGNRYILFKSSKVLACDAEDATSDKPWKNKGKSAGDA